MVDVIHTYIEVTAGVDSNKGNILKCMGHKEINYGLTDSPLGRSDRPFVQGKTPAIKMK